MKRLAKILITLPIVILPPAAVALRPALAEGLTGADAVSILARVETVDSRCRFLPASRHKQLSNYAARAELAMASQTSKVSARRAAAAGAAEGRTVKCNDAALAEVADTFAAARDAVAAADSAAKPNPIGTTTSSATGLSLYGRLLNSYYIERKCRYLSPRQDHHFWRSIGRLHRNVVAAHGAARVRPLMQRAESGARNHSCGEGSFAIVHQGFNETIRQ